ncbi:pyrimidine utilization protein D [Pseudocolwellia sp. AS88]|nr:pyrimidine utilization protein D [Pseudocolwellia sp. AS88]MDO7085251.1 pyrimidine utilization protein D [Pseudocolwellia sp. AS88]
MYIEVLGQQNANAPTVVFSSGLGGSAHFWQGQLKELCEKYRVVIYDQLGTGRSPAQLPKNYSIEHMADELQEALNKLDITTFHFVGHALGGLVGLVLAQRIPKQIMSAVLVNAWSYANPHTLRCFAIRKSLLASGDNAAYLKMQALLLYPPDWINANIGKLEEEERHMQKNFPDMDNLLLRIGALSQFDIDKALASINVKTLVIANKDDLLVPWQQSENLASKLPSASLCLMEYGGHASSISTPDEFNRILIEHLENVS